MEVRGSKIVHIKKLYDTAGCAVGSARANCCGNTSCKYRRETTPDPGSFDIEHKIQNPKTMKVGIIIKRDLFYATKEGKSTLNGLFLGPNDSV